MDRQIVYKSAHNITLRQKLGEAQNLYLGDAQIRALGPLAPFTQTATTQRPIMLSTMNITSDTPAGDITNITVSGLSLFTSNQSAALECFSPQSFGQRQRVIGLSMSNNQTVVVQGNLTAGGNVAMAVAVDPIAQSAVKQPADQSSGYNFIFGLGSVVVPAIAGVVPGTAQLVAVAVRDCTLGELILASHTAAIATAGTDIIISSINVAGLEQLCGATATQNIPLQAFQNTASDANSGLRLSYPVLSNARVVITLLNFNAGPITVAGGIFCEPWK